jgi:hypothetical protein
MFGESPVEGADLGGWAGLAFGFWVGGLEKKEGDCVSGEGEKDAEEGAGWARGVMVPREGEGCGAWGFRRHVTEAGLGDFFLGVRCLRWRRGTHFGERLGRNEG